MGLSREVLKDRDRIRHYVDTGMPLSRDIFSRVGDEDPSYLMADFKRSDATIYWSPISLEVIALKMEVPAERQSFIESLKIGSDSSKVIIPNFPTVYSPLNNSYTDRGFVREAIAVMRELPLKDGDAVLDAATGTGILVWVQSLIAGEKGVKLKHYAFDVNPIAVANARVFAKVAGIDLTVQAHDNWTGPSGRPVFCDRSGRPVLFKFVTSNNPAFDAYWFETLFMSPRTLKQYWDGGAAGRRYAYGLAATLGQILDGRAVLWNMVDDPKKDLL